MVTAGEEEDNWLFVLLRSGGSDLVAMAREASMAEDEELEEEEEEEFEEGCWMEMEPIMKGGGLPSKGTTRCC